MKRILIVLPVALALAACGAARDLKPAAGESLPVAPYGAAATPTPHDLLTASPQARPERNTELLKNSERRQPDPFDLPPR